jgi:hypothetical protein
MSNPNTALSITGINIPPYAARGLVETLSPVPEAAQLERTVTGDLIDLSVPSMQKYQVVITGNDLDPPGYNGLHVGTLVTVDCISELAYLTSGGSADRTVVPGSSRVDGAYTFYRPRLSMRVAGFQMTRDEWSKRLTWVLSLVEI